ncbi:4Fe-4S double cluster binding domain-containing protein [Methanobrevibacter sp.]|uniref:4Fe-4S double cluster binding domain-containing protein n=1 Tax=Methanobrevibacter sp. TaxID=66852 RepID=UPI0025DA72F7|nr:4Fe-4S double cluster binding domain-containing protein [Methanobrevibacter sp.]MBQ2665299.1 epoxyqueuosine reductase [Methanobrevibacter sp.]
MSISLELKNYLSENGATEVGFADITNFTPKEGLEIGVVFYITYPKEIIRNMQNAPTPEYLQELISLNTRLDALGMKCEEFLIDKGYDAYAQTKKRLGTDFGEFNSFELPHKTIATRAGLGWIGKSALFTTKEYGSALRLSSVLTNAPLDTGKPILKSKCGKCMECKEACFGGAISGKEWNYKLKRNDFYDDKKCEKYALKISEENLGKPDTVCGKCIFACPHTQKYIKKL